MALVVGLKWKNNYLKEMIVGKQIKIGVHENQVGVPKKEKCRQWAKCSVDVSVVSALKIERCPHLISDHSKFRDILVWPDKGMAVPSSA